MFQRLKDDIKALLSKFTWSNMKADATEVEQKIHGFIVEVERLEGVLAEVFGGLLKNTTVEQLIAMTGLPAGRITEILALVQPLIDKLANATQPATPVTPIAPAAPAK